MKSTIRYAAVFLTVGFLLASQAFAAHQIMISRPIVAVEGEVQGINETLTVAVKDKSTNQPSAGGKVTYPATAGGVATSPQYVEIAFASNALGGAVILSTANSSTNANPKFETTTTSNPDTGASGAGLVGTNTALDGNRFTASILWTVFDATNNGGYAFTGSLGDPAQRSGFIAEGAVLDKAQKKTFNAQGQLIDQLFDSADALGYASIVTGMFRENGSDKGNISSFPFDSDGVTTDGNGNGKFNDDGLRAATSPVVVYLGADFRGKPAQRYATNTLTIELIHQ